MLVIILLAFSLVQQLKHAESYVMFLLAALLWPLGLVLICPGAQALKLDAVCRLRPRSSAGGGLLPISNKHPQKGPENDSQMNSCEIVSSHFCQVVNIKSDADSKGHSNRL